MRSARIAGVARTVAAAALAAAVWALAQGAASPETQVRGAPANRAPVLTVFPDRVSVRAGERASVALEALDPDVGADGAAEGVWLGAAPLPGADGAVPAWLTEAGWRAGPSERPRLELSLEPPPNAPAGIHTIEAGATDARGLSALATFELTVLPSRCGALEIAGDGVCERCPENRLPDASRTFCEPCPAGTERPAGAAACTACPPGMTSEAGGLCGCGDAAHRVDGACVACPPHAESLGDVCVACPPDTERPAGMAACTDCPPGGTSPGGVACAPPLAVQAAARTGASGGPSARSSTAPDTTAPRIVAAEYSGKTVTLTMSEPVWVESPAESGDFVVLSKVVYRVAGVRVASRRADARATIELTLEKSVAGSARVRLTYAENPTALRRPRDTAGNRMAEQTVTVRPRRTLTVRFDGVTTGSGIAENAGEVGVTLALDNPPDAGGYTGCGLRLAAGGVAGTADVEFPAGNATLNPGNRWRAANAKLLKVVDDALAEGDEALAVEPYCTGGSAGMDPAASGLVSEPATVVITDDESRTVALAAAPSRIVETAGATRVTVTATLDGRATEELEFALTLSGLPDGVTVAGTKRISIAAGATSGSTVLTVTPKADADDADAAVAIGSALTGYAVTGATLTVAEPPPPPTVVVSVAAATLDEDAGKVNVRLTVRNPPPAGGYTGCRLRLGAGGAAETPADVTFQNQKKLTKEKGWTAQAKLLTVVDDAVAEGDETLVVEGHCTGRKSGTEPPHTELVSKPLTLTIRDNDATRALTLSVDPARIGETLGRQPVDVTAAVAAAPGSPVTVGLSLGPGAYTVTGTRSVTIPADATRGTATLAFTPRDDGNASDDTVSIGGSAPGYAVSGTSLTIAEPTAVGGVDLSGLSVELTVSPTAIREGTGGAHRVTAKLRGVDVPKVDVAMTLAVGGTATQGTSHDYTLAGAASWEKLTVKANDAHLSASTEVTVRTLADDVDEAEETVTFTVAQVTWGSAAVVLGAPAAATLRVTEAWDKPKAPKGLAAARAPGNETRGLDVRWKSVTATPPVDDYVVRHRAVSDPPAGWTQADPQPGLETALTGLNAGTRYELRVFARNAAGDGAESGSVFVHTADGGCPMAAPSVAPPRGARSSSDLTVSWRAPACGSSLAGYRLRYRQDPEVEKVENDWTEIAAAGTTATVTGLTADTAHVVSVRAVAVGGDRGPWSPDGKGRTGLDTRLPPRPGAPAVAPHAVDGASRLEATWTRVSWTDERNAAHPVAEYQYRHRPDGGAWTAETDARAASGETAAMTRSISGLAVGTWYEVQVRAVNRAGGVAYPGKWSQPGRGRTWGAPDRVEQPAAYLTGTAVEVVWEAPHDGGSPITDYDVEYKTDSGGWRPHPYAGCPTGACATEASINAVAKKVRVRAGNALGTGAWSPTGRVQQRKLLRLSYGTAAATVREGESLLVTVRLDSAADRAVSAPVTRTGDASAFRLDGLTGDAVAFGLATREQTFTFAAVQDTDDTDEKITLGFGTLPDGVRLEAPASLVVTVVDDESKNGRPAFDAGTAATRTVAENAPAGAAVGLPVTATDPEKDALTYTLGGTHAALFAVDGSSGQIKVGPGTALDFEGAVNSYAVTVAASDGKNAAGEADTAVDASIAVTVNVTDVAETPGAPGAPTLTPAAASLAVTWKAPDNTGPAITGYDVHHRGAGAADWKDAKHVGTATSTTLGGLSPGTAHEVRVRARSDEGTGGWSASAAENTLPAVSLSADNAKPEIADGDAAVSVTLSALPGAAGGGTLTGAWLARGGDGAVSVLKDALALTDGVRVTRAVSSSAPGPRTYGFRATHALDSRTRAATAWVTVDWRPKVILSAAPGSVREDGGAAKITVTARLTGTTPTDAAKTVTVSVSGGTATVGDDYASVEDFTVGIAGGKRSADGSFTLTPVADGKREGPETVAVAGTATDGGPISVTGATVSIVDANPTLTVTAPANGHVTGTTGGGDTRKTVIDCGSGKRTDCSETLPSGTAVTLTATADAKHLFGGWSGACSGTAGCTVTLGADRTVGATFVAARRLTVAAPAHGKVTGRIGTRTVIDCGNDCTETVADGVGVTLTANPGRGYRFDSWGDACASETSAECALTLSANRTVSVSFVSAAVAGKCDETAVDACAAGTPNRSAVADSDSHHRWRCDGAGGGANSGTCTRAKAGCRSGPQSWSAGGYSCAASIASAASGQTRAALDAGDPTRGSAAYKCDDGAWSEQAGGTCTVDLRCGSRENVCLPGGVEWQDRSDAAARDGACAGTESAGCLNGTTYSNRDDVPLENGVCGSSRDACTGGNFASRSDTDSEYRWRCLGVDAEDRWACLGIDGSKNWSCSYGSQSKSCGVAVPASDIGTCGVGVATRDASDAECSICQSGYHRDDDDECVENPMCPDPLVENTCKAGTPGQHKDTAVDGKCARTEAARCTAGRFEDAGDAARTDGRCGAATNSCVGGSKVVNIRTDHPRKNLWDCEGIDGARNWTCKGIDGTASWSCGSGKKTQSCSMVSDANDRSCEEVDKAKDYLNCFTCKDCTGANELPNATTCACECKDGFERHKGACVAKCKANESRDANGNCVCKAGLEKVGGTCSLVRRIVVSPIPTKCHVTAGKGVAVGTEKADGISCGYNGTANCVEYYLHGTTITLTKAEKAGYLCTWKGICSGTSATCTHEVTSSGTVSASGKTTLMVDPGGVNGEYTATYTFVRLPPPLPPSTFYSATVIASASGGVPGYTFKWSGRPAGAKAVYIYRALPSAGKDEKVVVTDRDGETGEASAKIKPPSTSGSQQSSGEDVVFEVPSGGELYFIWGGEGDVTAKSQDETVVLVGVSSPGIRVMGVGFGETLVEVGTEDGKLYLPVAVR